MKLIFIISIMLLSGCVSPPDTSMLVKGKIEPSSLSSDQNVISSKNGLLANNLSGIIGMACLPDNDGKCNTERPDLTASPCLTNTAKVALKLNADPSPIRHFLMNNQTQVSGNAASLINLSISSNEVKEVTVSIVATAIAQDPSDMNDGFPGRVKLAECLSDKIELANVSHVYWIKSANVISVKTVSYKEVANTAGLTFSGFGLGGKVYNRVGEETTDFLIGLDIKNIDLPKLMVTNNGGNGKPAIFRSRTTRELPRIEDVNTFPDAKNVFDFE